jgi:hypothetical protein
MLENACGVPAVVRRRVAVVDAGADAGATGQRGGVSEHACFLAPSHRAPCGFCICIFFLRVWGGGGAGEPARAASIGGTGPAFGPQIVEERFQVDSNCGMSELVEEAGGVREEEEVARLAMGVIVEATGGLALRFVAFGAVLVCSAAAAAHGPSRCGVLAGWVPRSGPRGGPRGADGGQKRGDILIAELGKNFDLSIVTLDEVVDGGFRENG